MRIWKSDINDDGSIHCLGNGRLAVYEQGPQIIQAFGPPYSTGSLLRILMEEHPSAAIHSVREPGAGIWGHEILDGGVAVGTMTDFVDSDLPCFVRTLSLARPVRFTLTAEAGRTVAPAVRGFGDRGAAKGLLVTAEAGSYFYAFYPSPRRHHLLVAVTGSASQRPGPCDGEWLIECGVGESTVYIIGGPEYPQAMENAEAALRAGPGALLERTRRWWRAFTARRRDFPGLIGTEVPLRGGLLDRVDDVSVLLKAQQSVEGGVLAGHNFHLGYVRDQYGVSRCLLALGYNEEARAILAFYWGVWSAHGAIHNAQAMGLDGVFHVHENDAVEITGYLIIQAFDYLRATGDDAFVALVSPMLFWAWDAQAGWLVDGMLPFNGDETYVAGGILPRSALNDGSAEATLLFVEAGERLLAWAEGRGVRSSEALAADRGLLRAVRGAYAANFMRDGTLVTNNPLRAARAPLPRFRHGVCEGCGCPHGITWTERSPCNRYLCPDCICTKDVPAAAPTAYAIQSVTLTPLYFGSGLVGRGDVARLVAPLVAAYRATGRLPSRPDGDLAVGYDYGLLLYSLTALGDPAARDVYEKMLAVTDSTGSWVEYYRNHAPTGTRCRPWESGINLEAGLFWALAASKTRGA